MGIKMVQKRKEKVLTEGEEKLWEALKKSGSVVQAAHNLNIEPKSAYNVLYRLRKKYRKARQFVNFVEGSKRGNTLLRMVMTSRIDLVEQQEEDEEE